MANQHTGKNKPVPPAYVTQDEFGQFKEFLTNEFKSLFFTLEGLQKPRESPTGAAKNEKSLVEKKGRIFSFPILAERTQKANWHQANLLERLMINLNKLSGISTTGDKQITRIEDPGPVSFGEYMEGCVSCIEINNKVLESLCDQLADSMEQQDGNKKDTCKNA